MKKGELAQIRESVGKLTNHYSEIRAELRVHRWLLSGVVLTLLGLAGMVIAAGIGG